LETDRATLAAFIVGSVLAGGNAVGVVFTVRELDPLWGAGLRFAAAALILFAVIVVLHLPLPRGRNLSRATLFGLLNFAAAFALLYYAFQEVDAGFGQVVLALVPLLTLLLAVVQRLETFRWAAAGGAVIALIGVLVMSEAALRQSVPLLSLFAVIGGSLCLAEATVVVGWLKGVHPVSVNAVGMAVGATALLIGSLIVGESWSLPTRSATWTAVLYLILVGSVVVFVLYVFVIERWGPARAAYTLALIPVFTVIYSVWLLDEMVTWELLVGGALVLAGVYVGALRRAFTAA
jgi:drug/metabolite transporter (DMT)-like permease